MHFTFIALTPIVDVSFLSYQYKIFACKLSAMEKQTWWHRERQGLSLQTTHSKPPRASRPLQLLRGTALRTWTKPFAHASWSRAGCQIWLARGRQACGNERGKTPRSACDQPPKSRIVCVLPSLVGTPAPCTSGTLNAGPWHSLRGEVAWWDATRLIAHGYGSAVSCSGGKPAWCSQSHPFGRGMWSHEGSAGATRRSDGFPVLMLSMGSFTAWPDQNFLPSCFPTTPPASVVAVAKPSPMLP